MRKIYFQFLLLACYLPAQSQTQVLMQHNNINRTGWNNSETVLNDANVRPGSFGLLFTRSVDDQIYAQPLVARVTVPGTGIRNLVFVATVNNSVYAFDADSMAIGNPYWHVNLTPTGWRVMRNMDTACGSGYADFSGSMGIVGTPVIDPVSQTLYVVAKTVSNSSGMAMYQQQLHALDLVTGNEKVNSPVTISATIVGSGNGSNGGKIDFNPQLENQRSGLLLSNGVVYIAWAAYGDCGDYHGWILGYDKTTLALKYTYNTTPDGYQGGIWMSSGGLSADDAGNIYASVGNGAVGSGGDPSDPVNRSESALKLTPNGSSLTVSSFFTPANYEALEAADLDFGVTGMLLLPGKNQVFSGAKDGNIYLMNKDSMGGYTTGFNNVLETFTQPSSDAHNLSSLTYYKGAEHEYAYIWSDNVPLVSLPYNESAGKFDLGNMLSSSIQGPVGYNGAFLSGSANDGIDSTAILWASHAAKNCNANQQTCPGILRAIDPIDISKEIWNSSMTSGDGPGNYAKFSCPTIANGKVYLATFSNKLDIYGLNNGRVTGFSHQDTPIIKVYPNPASEVVHVEHGDVTINYLYIFNLNGEKVLEKKGSFEKDEDIALRNIPAGLYIIEMVTPHGSVKQKILVAN